MHRTTEQIVALKKVRMEEENDGLPISSLREIALLKSLNHQNIIRVHEVAVGYELDNIFLGNPHPLLYSSINNYVNINQIYTFNSCNNSLHITLGSKYQVMEYCEHDMAFLMDNVISKTADNAYKPAEGK